MLATVTLTTGLRRDKQNDWQIVSILYLAFLVYPGTLEHYGVFLVVPVLMLLKDSTRPIFERVAIFLIVLSIYFLSGSFHISCIAAAGKCCPGL